MDRWLPTNLGVEDTEYSRAVGSRWPISAVARIFRPWAKADCCLILEGTRASEKRPNVPPRPWPRSEVGHIAPP